MQHAALREAQVKPAPRAGDRHIHQAAFLIQTTVRVDAILVREQALFQAGDEHGVKLQPLGSMHSHQMQRIVLVARLMFARFQRCMSEERSEAVVLVLVHEQRGRVDEFVKILQPLLGLAFFDAGFVLIVCVQAAVFQHVIQYLGEGKFTCRATQRFNQSDESRYFAARTGCRIEQRRVVLFRRFLQLLYAARADAARREIDDAQQRVVVIGVFHQAQIGQRVLDLLALVKTQPTVNAIRQSGGDQRVLQHPRLRVGTVQQCDFLEIDSLGFQLLDFADDETRFFHVRRRFIHAQRLAATLGSPQILAEAVAVAADQRIRGIQNISVRAVVLLQLDDVLDMKVAQ